MSGTTLIICILLCRVAQKISSKSISNRMPGTVAGIASYTAFSKAIAAAFAAVILVFFASEAESLALPPLGWILSCATGATLAISSVCSLLSMRGSSIVLNSLFSMAGLLVPTIAGIFLFGQPVTPAQWGGIALLFLAAWLLASSSNKTNGRLTVKTVLLLFGSMLANGGTMLLQVLYKTYVPGGSVRLYSFLQFIIPALVLLPLALAFGRRDREKLFVPKGKLLFFTLISALSTLLISQFSTIASAVIPIAVLFPVSDGGGMVIAALIAATVYKEKMTVKSGVGIVVGIAGVVAMKLFGA